MAYWEFPVVGEPQTEPTWRCHRCGRTGEDEDGMNAATHVIGHPEDPEWVPDTEWVYLRPHCDSCLPKPPGRERMAAPEWRAYHRATGKYTYALRQAVDDGAVQAKTAYRIRCPVCGREHTEGHGPYLPVYSPDTDRDESVCGPCYDTVPLDELAEAYRRRAQGQTPYWAK